MSVLRPTLDDVTYADLIAAARARIPALDPAWTDHNPSDPGITLLELFGWLSEMLVYRADCIPDDRYRAFLTLLRGDGPDAPDVHAAIAETLRALRTPWRAATASDVEHLLRVEWPADPAAAGWPAIRRVHCAPRRDLTADPAADRPGSLSVVVVPERDGPGVPVAGTALCDAVHAWLEPRRLLGVRHHVVGPAYLPVTVTGRLVLRPGYATDTVTRSGVLTDATIAADVARRAGDAVAAHLDPLTGGADGQGWPFGRNVYLSELYRLLDELPGVDHVDGLGFAGLPAERLITDGGDVVGAALGPAELVDPGAAALSVVPAQDGRSR